ncbi:MAG: SPOR domain-containing protein [Gammaproteobacteria bacterium]|nr:SPOR domain-containing protein [Gammaproteobacteria bacterium]
MEDKRLKQRLIGAVVLISLGVIFIPMLLKGPDSLDAPIFTSNIPQQPEQRKTEIIPLKPLPPRPVNIPITAIPVEVDTYRPQPEAAPVSPPKVEAVPVPKTDAQAAKIPILDKPTSDLSGWAVQVGSFSSKKNALGLQKRLRAKNYAAFVEAYQAKSGVRYRVRIGPELTSDKAKQLAVKLKRELGIDGLVLRHK